MRRDVFQAIADPTRREIINLIAHGKLNLNAVADNFTISRPAISKHIRILTECGLIVIKQQGRERYCEAQLETLSQVSEWIEPYKTFWAGKLDALKRHLSQPEKRIRNTNQKINKNMGNPTIILERVFNAAISKVWKAITDKNEMKKWYFDLSEFKAETGFKFQFAGGPSPDKQYLHLCEITEVIPEKKLTYSWRYDGYTGISFVTFELFEQAGKTLLKLTHTGIETFPAENPDFAIGNFNDGWNHIIHTSLKAYLEPVTSKD